MRKTLAEIAKIIHGEVVGNKDLVITGLSGIKEASEGDLTFVSNPKYFPLVKTTKASAILFSREMNILGKIGVRVDQPSLAFAELVSFFSKEDKFSFSGIHKTAVVSSSSIIGKNVSIGPYVVIEDGAQIGDDSIIYSGSYVGYKSSLGKGCVIYPHVVIREKISIGDRVTIHSGSVIGSDGFGYAQSEGIHKKIPQIGNVIIEDDVEIGANVTIDRARFNKTVIGRGSKIDNLVQIAHNCIIGENCVIISQVGISGSTVIEKNSILAGQAGIAGHLTIGEGSVVAAQSGVTHSLPAFSKVSGYPAKPHEHAKKVNAYVQRLPIYIKELKDLKKKIEDLELKGSKVSKTKRPLKKRSK